jgi:hypothetical protein
MSENTAPKATDAKKGTGCIYCDDPKGNPSRLVWRGGKAYHNVRGTGFVECKNPNIEKPE